MLNPDPHQTPAGLQVSELIGTWWVACTRSKQDKALAADLLRQGVGYFLPQFQRTRISHRVRRTVRVPVFPGYVFVLAPPADEGSADTLHLLRAGQRVYEILPVIDQHRLHRQLIDLDRALALDNRDREPWAAIGQKCRVIAGHAMEGIEGVLVRTDSAATFVLDVTLLGKGVPLEIDPVWLEPVN